MASYAQAQTKSQTRVRDKTQRYRWRELSLLVIPFLILVIGMTQLLLLTNTKLDPTAPFSTKSLPPIQGLIPIFGLIALMLALNAVFSFFFKKADQYLLPAVGMITGIGVLMALRQGPDLFNPNPRLGTFQLIWAIIGAAACLGTMFALRDLNFLKRYKYTFALLGLVLVSFTLVNAFRVKLDSPTHDQLNIGPFSLQPSELLKIFIVVFFAGYLSENRDILAGGSLRVGPFRLPPLRQLGPILLMLAISLLFFLVVREIGLALLIYSLFLCMIYLGAGKFSYVAVGLLGFLLFGFIGYMLLGYIRNRFATVGLDMVNWQDWSPATSEAASNGYLQIVQGIIALSSGGILGAGLGLGHPTIVPVSQSDMVFVALGEELGLAGLFAIIGLYLLIIYRGFRIAIEASDTFQQLLAAGLTSIFAIQTLIICAGNMKFFPLTGIPLPFLSYGGSSLIANFIIIGILLRISHQTGLEREGLA